MLVGYLDISDKNGSLLGFFGTGSDFTHSSIKNKNCKAQINPIVKLMIISQILGDIEIHGLVSSCTVSPLGELEPLTFIRYPTRRRKTHIRPAACQFPIMSSASSFGVNIVLVPKLGLTQCNVFIHFKDFMKGNRLIS